MPPLYRVRDWDDIYEHRDQRNVKNMKWVSMPVQLDGDGYTLLMEQGERGSAMFGAFMALVQLGTKCVPRGTFWRRAGEPHSPASIARITRHSVKLVEDMLDFCSKQTKWIDVGVYNETTGTCDFSEKIREFPGKIPPTIHNTTLQDTRESMSVPEDRDLVVSPQNDSPDSPSPGPSNPRTHPLIEHWQTRRHLVHHKTITRRMVATAHRVCKDYPLKEVLGAVDRYNRVMGSKYDYFGKYRHTFEAFFRNGVRKEAPFGKFLDPACEHGLRMPKHWLPEGFVEQIEEVRG
jgi:hypothetical protein